jgi:hypothetical protein
MGEKFKGTIFEKSRFYLEVNIGEQAGQLGYSDVAETYQDAHAIVPLKQAADGMKVRIDGRTFVNYAQFGSGIAVPGHVARECDLPYKTYIPNDSMILNYT